MASVPPNEPAAKRRPLFVIPSHAEVAGASRPAPPTNYFRPSSAPVVTPSHPSSTTFTDSADQRPITISQPATASGPVPSASATLLQPSGSSAGQAPIAGTFSDAFSFVRQTEHYTAPAPPPPLPTGHAFNSGTSAVQVPGLSASQTRNAIVVSSRQKGNPVLKHLRNVRWLFGDIVPDYLVGQSACALYLSLRYHLLHPDYLYFRIRELQKGFRLRVVLCHVDVDDVMKPLHEVTKTALLHECTLLCAWSVEECARYLETIKTYETKPADVIQERTDNDYLSRLTSALTTVRGVNKTDVLTLGSTFKSLSAVLGASMEEVARCPGIGERKVKRLWDAFHEPFRRTSKQMRLSGPKEGEGGLLLISGPEGQGGAEGGGNVLRLEDVSDGK